MGFPPLSVLFFARGHRRCKSGSATVPNLDATIPNMFRPAHRFPKKSATLLCHLQVPVIGITIHNLHRFPVASVLFFYTTEIST